MSRFATAFVLTAVLLAAAPSAAFAHAVGVAYTIRGDKVEVEAFYDDDSPAAKAKVVVVNDKDDVIADGVTDSVGKWTFAVPAAGKYEIRIDAGAGHRARKVLQFPAANPVPESAPNDPPPSGSQTRADATRTPWLKIGLGLAVIAVGGILVAGRRWFRAA